MLVFLNQEYYLYTYMTTTLLLKSRDFVVYAIVISMISAKLDVEKQP